MARFIIDIKLDKVSKDRIHHALLGFRVYDPEKQNWEEALERLFERWDYFTQHVAEWYSLDIDSYDNDLSGREAMQRIIDVAPDLLKEKLLQLLIQPDKRFYEATVESKKPFTYEPNVTPDGFWWHRIPIRRSGQMEEGLRREGYI